MIRCPRCSHEWNPARQALTKRQLDVFRWIEAYIRREGVAPRQSEIAKGLGFASLSTVHEHLENLERKGALVRTYNAERGLVLLVRSDELGSASSASDGGREDGE